MKIAKFKYLKLNEWIFILAGVVMLASIPFFDMAGFSLWVGAKAIYVTGLVIYVWNRNI